MPDVDLFVRSSGENRTSNFLLWQSAYAEFVFLDTLWPDFDRRHLWAACEEFASRQRRFGTPRGGAPVSREGGAFPSLPFPDPRAGGARGTPPGRSHSTRPA